MSHYLKEAHERAKKLRLYEEKITFYANFYQQFLKSLRVEKRVEGLTDLLPGHSEEESSPPDLTSLQVLLNIQIGNTIKESFQELYERVMDAEPRAFLKLTLVIDRQSIKFLEQEEDIINAFRNIVNEMLDTSVEGFPVSCNF